MILNCARQVGKTTVLACHIVHEVLYHAPALVLVLGPAERQSKELIRSVSRIRDSMGLQYDPDRQSMTSMEFLNGSRVVALPSKEGNIRGLAAVTLLVMDEASRIPDEVYNAVKPMLSISRGRLALLSTPNGKRGFFHKEWTEGEGWERFKVTAYECSRYSPEQLALEKRSQPANWFQQEYLCEFSDTEGMIFSYEDIQRAVSSDVLPLFNTNMGDADVKPLYQ